MGSNPVVLFAAGAVVLAVGIGVVLLFRARPRLAVACWVIALYFTPVWLGVQAGVFFSVLTAITLLAIVAFMGGAIRWSIIDTLVLLLVFVLIAAHLFGGSNWANVQDVLVTWMVPYVFGRLILGRVSHDWIATCIAVAAVGAALLAIVESFTATNLFFLTPGASSSIWGSLQYRGGMVRVEGAFGHSIALGGSLALSGAFVLATRWRTWIRMAAVLVVVAATVLTFSRIGITGLVLSLALSALLLGRFVATRVRVVVLLVLSVVAAFALPLLLDVFGDAGSEATGSAEYRADLLPLLETTVPVGAASSREVLATGEERFGGYRSIDSALILLALRFGWVSLILVVAMLLIAIFVVLRRRGSPATVALVAQIPAFATVALITQYGGFVWFIAGLAVASYTLEARGFSNGALARRPGREKVGAP